VGDIKERDSMFSANLGRHKNKNAEKITFEKFILKMIRLL